MLNPRFMKMITTCSNVKFLKKICFCLHSAEKVKCCWQTDGVIANCLCLKATSINIIKRI